MNKRNLPIGIQSFEKLRESNCLYVDKTQFVYDLAQTYSPYFLSRPRRFGKSLLVSTMKAYFEGKKELFTGLALEKLEKDWIEYPIVYLNFSQDGFSTDESLKSNLNSTLSEYEEKYQIINKEDRFALRLKKIIQKANEITGKKVVVLIDEYDKPILDALYTEYEEKNRTILRDFYVTLKANDEYIRFLFITGITDMVRGGKDAPFLFSEQNTSSFAKQNLGKQKLQGGNFCDIFSGLNQLEDISLEEKYSSLCGISETELVQYFMPEIEELAKKQEMSLEETKAELAKMYDGYHFAPNSEGVYNPFCLLRCLKNSDFGSYWFESGTPSFLVKTLQNQPFQLFSIMDGRKATETQFKDYDPDSKNMLPVIYQSGYLTIKDFEKRGRIYTLGFPNKEVEDGFLNAILPKFISVPDDDLGLSVDYLRKAFAANELEYAMRIVKACFSDIPTIVQKNMCENFYEAITHVLFRMTGFDVVSEMQSIFGRSDIIVTTQTDVYIFELKTVPPTDFEKGVADALAQIEKKGYAERYSVSGKTTHKIALVFADDASGVLGWREENE